jgi:hypothetical protein
MYKCPVSLAQLVGQLHYICRGPGFELWSSHLSTLKVEFLTTRLLDQKKKTYMYKFVKKQKEKNILDTLM